MADRKPVPLDVVGQVLVEMGGSSAKVECRGDRIVVGLPDLRSAVATARMWSRGGGRRDSILGLHQALVSAGLRLEVVVGASIVGVLGEGSHPGVASRLLGIGPLEVRPGGVLGSLRRPADPKE